jgi:chromosome partitioning protein
LTILAIASSKGGVGKTTLVQLLAARLALDGLKVAILDADANKGAVGWIEAIYEGPPIRAVAETDDSRVAHLMPELAELADVLLVDSAGFGNIAAAVAMAGADHVLIPTLPGRADLLEAERTVQRARGLAKASRRQIGVSVVLNRVQRATGLTRHAITQAEELGLPRLTTMLSQSVAYGEIGFTGRLPSSAPAADELAALLAELRAMTWLPLLPVYTLAASA